MTSHGKLQDLLAYPPRGMDADRAAAYCCVSKTKFLEGVESGDWPPAKEVQPGLFRWDRLDLDAAWDAKKERERKRALSASRATMDELMEAEGGQGEHPIPQ
jgi:hypothetical protein